MPVSNPRHIPAPPSPDRGFALYTRSAPPRRVHAKVAASTAAGAAVVVLTAVLGDAHLADALVVLAGFAAGWARRA